MVDGIIAMYILADMVDGIIAMHILADMVDDIIAMQYPSRYSGFPRSGKSQ